MISKKSPEKSTGNTPRITSKKLKLNKQTQRDLAGLQASGSWAVITGVDMIWRRATAYGAEFVINKETRDNQDRQPLVMIQGLDPRVVKIGRSRVAYIKNRTAYRLAARFCAQRP